MQGVLISPNFSEIRAITGDDLNDAIAGFWSSEWKQGWNPDQKILEQYGDWVIYQKMPDGSLKPIEQLKKSSAIVRFLKP